MPAVQKMTMKAICTPIHEPKSAKASWSKKPDVAITDAVSSGKINGKSRMGKNTSRARDTTAAQDTTVAPAQPAAT